LNSANTRSTRFSAGISLLRPMSCSSMVVYHFIGSKDLGARQAGDVAEIAAPSNAARVFKVSLTLY
ncbi:hypothetical protein, partial [Pseudomarimonas arenosa]|uniref:hypothetical protein n=1 Tax=Pseudomarimonas arenosa TaxID=2774145 RepID=UPI001CDC58CD